MGLTQFYPFYNGFFGVIYETYGKGGGAWTQRTAIYPYSSVDILKKMKKEVVEMGVLRWRHLEAKINGFDPFLPIL